MKRTINYKELVGQQVVCYVPLTTVENMIHSVKVFTVTAVGTKYIKAGKRNFDKQTLRCENPFSALYFGTPEEFSRYIRLKLKVRKQMDRLTMRLDKLELHQLEKLDETLGCILCEPQS